MYHASWTVSRAVREGICDVTSSRIDPGRCRVGAIVSSSTTSPMLDVDSRGISYCFRAGSLSLKAR
jgi:hypothetical protein